MVRQENGFCPQCGKAIKAGVTFCSKCGTKNPRVKIRAGKTNSWMWIAGAVVIVALLSTFVVSGIKSGKQRTLNRAHTLAQVESIISAFDCSCGQCEKTLKVCDCPTAEEMKKFISETAAQEGYARQEIIKIVNERYGHLRGDIATK